MRYTQDSTLSVILIATLLFWSLAPISEIQEKTVYFSSCPDSKHNSLSCPEKLLYNKTSFKVFPKEQLVVSDYLYDLKPCVVFDKDNWECQGSNNIHSMHSGKYREEADSSSLGEKGKETNIPRYTQITSVAYYIQSTITFFRNFR